MEIPICKLPSSEAINQGDNMTTPDISERKTFQGAFILSAIVNGQLIERQFMGYTRAEAYALFRETLTEV